MAAFTARRGYWFSVVHRLEGLDRISHSVSRAVPAGSGEWAVPFEVRQLLYGQAPHVYRILFMMTGDTVYVLHIRHARHQPLKQ
jgi:hypothetical protein